AGWPDPRSRNFQSSGSPPSIWWLAGYARPLLTQAVPRSAQRRPDVGDEVGDILDADRQPQQVIADARRPPLLRGHGAVAHGGRIAGKALDAAQAFGQGEHPQSLQECTGRGCTAL